MSDLFSILCTTCKTKLRVRDAAVIGQILACPKCSSMVLVEAPPGWAPPAPAVETTDPIKPADPAESNGNGVAHNGSAILKKSRSAASLPVAKAIPTPATVPAGKPTGVDPSLKETMSDSNFADVEALFGEASPPVTTKRVAEPATSKPKTEKLAKADKHAKAEKRRDTPAPPPSSAAGPAPATAPPVPSAADTVPPSTRRLRMIALLSIGGLMGISLAISAAYFAATWNGKPKEIAEKLPTVPVVDPVVPVDEQPPVKPEEVVDPPLDNVPKESTPPDELPTGPTKPEVEANKRPGDPLDIVNDTPRNSDRDPTDLEKLRAQLAALDTEGGSKPGDQESSPASSSPDSSTPPPDEPEASPSRPRPEPRNVDLAARLNDRLIEVEFTGQPLAEVLQFLSDLSAIPITLDPDALALPWSKTTPGSPVTAELKNATLEEVLMAVLKPLRLEVTRLENQIVVTRSAALKTIKCPIGDLTGTDAMKQQQLIDTITALAAPGSWKSAGGLGSLTPQGADLSVENTELAYGDVLQVCERLRQARGGMTKSVFPAESFALDRRTVRAKAKLDRPLTLNFGQPTLLVKILQRFAEETGTQIVVDWQAAGEIGWPPDVDATVALDKTPLRDALEKLLTPLDLTYRVIDARTLQVTTPAALERKPDFEVYPADDLAGTAEEAAALIERINASLGGTPVLRWDAPSKTLLALLTQPDQEELARLLESWRAK